MHLGRALLLAASLVAALGAVAGAAADTTFYRWVDKDGVVHYSDRPAPGAEKVRIGSAQTYPAPPPVVQPPRAAAPHPTAAMDYARVEITSPVEGETVANSGGNVTASAALEPGLADGDQPWFVVDGTRLAEPSPALVATFQVERGAHTVALVITDSTGQETASSVPVSFFYRQNSIASPPRGPLLPPIKKP